MARRRICWYAASSATVVLLGICLAQAPKPAYNKAFVVDRTVIAPVVTKIASVGPIQLLPEQTVSVPGQVGIRSLSLHVSVAAEANASSWELQVKTLSGTVQDTIISDSERGQLNEFWTSDVVGSGALVYLKTTKPGGGSVRATIDRYSYPAKPSVPQGIVGKDGRQRIRQLGPLIQKAGMPVARLRIKEDRGEALCTGFLVANDLLLTNFHCIATRSDAANSWADFVYELPGRSPSTYKIQKLELINSKEELDYSLVRVANAPGQKFGFVDLRAANVDDTFAGGRELLLIQHPAGEPKQVSIEGCVIGLSPTAGINPDVKSDFSHKCDTLSGSSGSPVLDLTSLSVLGLHHMGFDAEERRKTKNLDNLKLQNQAVYIGSIVADIRERSDPIARELGIQKRPPPQPAARASGQRTASSLLR